MRLLVLFFGGVDAGGGQGGAVPHATAGPPYRPSTPPRRGPPQRPGGPAGPPRPSPGRSVGTHCGGHGGIERRPSLGEAPEGTFQTRVQPLQKCNTDPQKSEAIKKTSKKQQQKNNRKITEKHKIRPILPMSQHIFKSKKTGLRPPTCLYPCAEPLRCIRVRTGSSIGLDDPDRKTGPSGTTRPRLVEGKLKPNPALSLSTPFRLLPGGVAEVVQHRAGAQLIVQVGAQADVPGPRRTPRQSMAGRNGSTSGTGLGETAT